MDAKKKGSYLCLAVIGSGSIDVTQVELACHSTKKETFALKSLNLEHFDVDEIQLELNVLKLCQHKNLLYPLEIFGMDNILCAVYSVMSYGSCDDLIKSSFTDGLPEAAIAYIFRDVVAALQYLHLQGYIHRSVQASHILISEKGEIKLSGLRHAYNVMRRGEKVLHVHQYPLHINAVMLWAAPEILAQDKRGYGCSSDIYSIGITACELGNGIVPFADIESTLMLLQKLNGVKPLLLDSTNVNQMIIEVEDGDEPSEAFLQPFKERQFSANMHQFVSGCLERNPFERPNTEELINCAFIKSATKTTCSDFLKLLNPVHPIVRNYSKNIDSLAQSLQGLDFDKTLPSVLWDFD